MAGAAAWIAVDMRYQQIEQRIAAHAIAVEFETALKQEIHESNARRFELSDYFRNATGR